LINNPNMAINLEKPNRI